MASSASGGGATQEVVREAVVAGFHSRQAQVSEAFAVPGLYRFNRMQARSFWSSGEDDKT